MRSSDLEPRTYGSGSEDIWLGQWRVAGRGLGRKHSGKGSLSVKAATAIDRAPSAIQLRHLILLIQEVQRVVAWEAADGELMRHLGPVLTVRGHTFVELCRFGEQVLQQPGEMWGQD